MPGFTPLTGGTSSGDGEEFDDGIQQRLHALFLNAEPQVTGTKMPVTAPRGRAQRSSVSTSGSSPSR